MDALLATYSSGCNFSREDSCSIPRKTSSSCLLPCLSRPASCATAFSLERMLVRLRSVRAMAVRSSEAM
jgi:hypothetical protein